MVTIEEGPVKIDNLQVEEEIILAKPREETRKKCVIPSCKNVGRGKHTFCNKHTKMYRYEKPEECPVCMEDLQNEKYPLRGEVEGKCGHWVHHSCVISSGKQECPICREKIKLKKEELSKLLEIQKKHKKTRKMKSVESCNNFYKLKED